MKTNTETSTWLGHIKEQSHNSININPAEAENIHRLVKSAQFLHPAFHHSIPAIYLLDYTTGNYITMSQTSDIAMGHNRKNFMDGGIDFTLTVYNKNDMELFNKKMFPDRLKILQAIPVKEHPNYIFSNNFRFANSRGEMMHLMQRNIFLKSDEKGIPLVSFGIIVNTSHFEHRRDQPVIQLVEKLNIADTNSPPILVSKKAYYRFDEDKCFTKREKEILLWMGDGLSSKEIAHKLFISINTVINHRKNMMLKSNSRNVAQLIKFALINDII